LPFESLRDFLEALEKAGEVRRIKSEVSPDLEIAEILRRVMYAKGPAILFENVEGSEMPVLGNAFGSMRRMEIALDTKNFESLGTRLTELLSREIPTSVLAKLRSLPKLAEITGYAPKVVKAGPVMEVIETEAPSLSFLPALKTWPKDGGKFITFGLVLTKNPDSGSRNLGVYRLQIYDDKTMAMHWQIHKRGALHFKMMQEQGKRLEVAIIIGADPTSTYVAVAPVPEGLDKYLFAGIVRRKGLELVRCQTVDLEVPANSEIILEGYVDPNDIRMEGPFGDHTGYYTPKEPYPTFHLTGVMRRTKPIYLTTVVGKPTLEDAYLGKVIERSFLPLVKVFQPEVVDMSMPPAGWFQGIAIFSIKKRYPGQAKKVMLGLWGLGQLSLTKIFIVVDEDVNIQNLDEVIWAVTTRADPKRDTLIIDGVPTDTLDPASPILNLGSKMGIDATVKTKEEGFERGWQDLEVPDPVISKKVDDKWSDFGLGD